MRHGRAAGLALVFLMTAPAVAAAASPTGRGPLPDGVGQSAGDSASVTMRMLLEKTIFRIDVLTLTVRVGGEAGARIRELVRDGSGSPEPADSVAGIVADATRARARLRFERDVSLGRFLDAVRESARRAREAGFIDAEALDFVEDNLPGWYSFLEGRGVREGDVMSYRIRGDSLRTRFRTADGRILLDQTDVGASRRRAVLGGYVAPGSDFREGLLRSLFRSEGGAP